MNTRLRAIALVVGGAASASLLVLLLLSRPAHWPVTETIGIDKWEYHRPFAGSREIRQQHTFSPPSLSRIDVLIVDLKRQGIRSPITLKLYAADQPEPLRVVEIDGTRVRDDYYLPFAFEPIPLRTDTVLTLTLSAAAADPAAPYAVRLTENKSSIAFRSYRATTAAYVVKQWITHNHERLITAITFFTVFFILAALLPHATLSRKKGVIILLVLVLAGGICLQWYVIGGLRGDPGGDSYYYYNAAHQIAHGVNPLSIKSYRVPLYSAFLMPGLIPAIPDFLYARLLGVAATVGIGIMLLVLARQLGFQPMVGLIAFAWLFFNNHYLVTSVRPRPYQVFAFLLLASTTLLFKLHTTRHAFWWGILLGITCMTRQEAFLPTAALGIAFCISLLRRSTPWPIVIRKTAAAAIPLFLIVAPYFYYNYQHYGHPFHNPYLNRADTQNPHSFAELWHDNVVSTRNVLGSAWLPSHLASMKQGSGISLLGTAAAGIFLIVVTRQRWWRNKITRHYAHHPLVDAAAAIAAVGISSAFINWLFFNGNNWAQQINVLVVAGMIIGAVQILRTARWRGAVVLIVLATQLGIATWFQPNPKHFQQAYPFLAFSVAAALQALGLPTTQSSRMRVTSWRTSLRVAPVLLLFGFLATVAWRSLGTAIDIVNFPAAPYYTTIEAAERMQNYPGIVAAERDTNPDNAAYTFHSYLQYNFIPYEEKRSLNAEITWLCQKQPRYLLDYHDVDFFTITNIPAFASYFRRQFAVSALGRDDHKFQTTVYELINRDQLCRALKLTHL